MDKLYIFAQFDNKCQICYNRQCASKKAQKEVWWIIVKNILKRIFIFSIVLLLSISNVNGIEVVNALKEVKKPQINKNIEIYNIKTKNERIASKSFVGFYEVDPNKEEFLEYKAEQERIEQERLEQERIARELKSTIANFAVQFVGNPYVMGGNSLTNGTDCSGLVQLVYANFGISLPRTTSEQAIIGTGVSIEEIEVGDIISYGYDGYVTHSAIYIGNGMIVHASTPELGIRIDSMYIMPIMTIRSVI